MTTSIEEAKEETLANTFKFSPVFKKRAGTTDRGKDYEHFYITHLILKLIADEEVENFSLSSNDETFGSFDDVVVEIKYLGREETEVYALQLKHSKNKILRSNDLIAAKGNFSLPEYFNDFKKNISCKNAFVKLVLFTNCKSNLENKLQLKIDGETLDVNVSNGTHNALLKTLEKSVCHVFTSTKCSTFFQNFALYSNEGNVEQIKRNAQQKFEQMFKSDVSRFNMFVDFIINWSMAEGKKMKLDKEWMMKVIFLCVLSPFVRLLSFSSNSRINQNKQLFRDMVAKFPISVLKSDSYDKIRDLWCDVIQVFNDAAEAQKVRKKYRNLLGGEDEEKTIILWLLEKCPLIVVGCPQVYQIITICKEQNLIVLDSVNHHEKTSLWFQSLRDVKQHIHLYEKVITTFRYTLEGQREECLSSLLEISQDVDKLITTDSLVQMIDGPLLIGSQKVELPPCHIERNLTKILIDSRYIENIDTNTVVVIENLDESKKLKPKEIYTSKCQLTENELSQIYLNNPEKNVHLFKYCDDTYLEWKRSIAHQDSEDCITEIEKFRLEISHGAEVLQESEIFNNIDNKINFICADPGMGKTTLMKNLKLKSSSTFWTVVMQARNCVPHFWQNKTDLDELLKNMCKQCADKLDQSVFENLIKLNQIQIIWDGLDEVSEESLASILAMIKRISDKGIRQWLTSRNHLKSQLERRLNTFSRSITQFDEHEQKKYIDNRLCILPEESNEIFAKIRKNVMAFSNNDILGIPLQIYMLTELLFQNKEKYFNLLEGVFTVLDVYDHFVEEKFNIFYKDKTKLDLENELSYQIYHKEKKETIDWYKSMAFDLYLGSYFNQMFGRIFGKNIKGERMLAKIKSCGDRVGLIISLPNSNNLVFSHNSYGEYFAALYLFEHNSSKARESAFIFNHKYDNIRFFLDLMLSKESMAKEACVAILHRNISLLENCDVNTLYEKDAIGRDVLELSCAWTKNYTVPKLKKGENVFYDLMKINDRERRIIHYKNISTRFYQIQDVVSGQIRKFMLLLPFLIPFYNEESKIFHLECLPIALYYAIKFDNTFIYDNMKSSFDANALYDVIEKRDVLFLALNLKSRNILQILLLDYDFHVILISSLKDILHHLSTIHSEIVTYVLHLKDVNGKMTIHNAVSMQDEIKNTKYLIDKYKDPCIPDAHGRLPLHYACGNYNGYMLVQLLINKGQEVNIPDAEGQMPLHHACLNAYGDEIVELLIDNGSGVNYSDALGQTSLHYACKNKGRNRKYSDRSYDYRDLLEKPSFFIVKTLIDNGASPEAPDSHGIRPIHYACENDNGYEIVKFLLENSVNINAPDASGRTPLYYACKSKQPGKTVQLLLRNGAYFGDMLHYAFENDGFSNVLLLLNSDTSRLYTSGSFLKRDVVKVFLDRGLPVDHMFIDNRTLLHYASDDDEGNDMVKLLTLHGANVNACDKSDLTPLHYASKHHHKQLPNSIVVGVEDPLNGECDDMLKLLLSYGANVNSCDINDVTPLHYACRNYHDFPPYLVIKGVKHNTLYDEGDERVKLLLDNGASVNACDKNGLTPLHYACKNYVGYKSFKNLVVSGANVNSSDHGGRKPMHYACQVFQFLEPIKFLLDNGADFLSPDASGLTPLHYACKNDGFYIAQFLLQVGACINAVDNNGQTPLHYACQYRALDVGQMLIDRGATLNIFDNSGKTPLHYACEKRVDDLIKLLILKGARVDVLDANNLLPIHYACNYNDVNAMSPIINFFDIIIFLIDEGVKVKGTIDRKQYALEHNLSNEILDKL